MYSSKAMACRKACEPNNSARISSMAAFISKPRRIAFSHS